VSVVGALLAAPAVRQVARTSNDKQTGVKNFKEAFVGAPLAAPAVRHVARTTHDELPRAKIHSELSQERDEQKMKFQAIKGTRDILPPDSTLWNRVEQTARETFATYGFNEIRPPIFEQTELFARSIGTDTDVVAKEMYTFPDKPAMLPDFRFEDPEMYTADLENRSRNGELFVSERTLARLRFELEKYKARKEEGSKERALLAWAFAVGGLDLGESTSLRPEATASVCRAYIEHGMQTLPGNVKLYYIGPMFRRERPQKGRYRQFYQIGAEVLGQSDAPAIDAEVIEMLLAFFEKAGLANATLSVNSIGDKNCRPQYIELLRAELQKVKAQLGPDSQRRIETNPLRVLDSKLPEEQAIIENLPRIADHLCETCRAHFAKLQEELKLRGIPYEINWRLVRGLDYYTRTTFEIVAPGLGSQNAVCGGGRYDGLVELLGGPPTKGIGFAIGTDRLILSLQETGKAAAAKSIDVYVAWMGEKAYAPSVKLARKLRDSGFAVELPPEEMKFKKSLGLADKLGARYALIIGEDEVASGQLTLKHLADGQQQKYSEPALLEHLRTARQT
jgi:histidyl-tRNA synthetase